MKNIIILFYYEKMELKTSNYKSSITDWSLYCWRDYTHIIESFFHKLKNKWIQLNNEENIKNKINEIITNTCEWVLISEFIMWLFNEILIDRFSYIEKTLNKWVEQEIVEKTISFNLFFLMKSWVKLLKNIETFTDQSFNKSDILDKKYIEFKEKFNALNNYFFSQNENILSQLNKILETNPLKLDFTKISKAFEILKIPNYISIVYLDLIYEYKIYFRELFSNINIVSSQIKNQWDRNIGAVFNYNSLISESCINSIQEVSFNDAVELTSILLSFPIDFLAENNNIQKIKWKIYLQDKITNWKIKENLIKFFSFIWYENNNIFINSANNFELSVIYFQLLNSVIKKLYELSWWNSHVNKSIIEKLSKLENFVPIKKLLKILLKKTNIQSIENITNNLNLIKNNKIFATQLKVSGLLVNLFTKYESKCTPLMKMQSRNLLWNLLKEKKMSIDLMEFIDDVQILFVDSLEWENIWSILHILENITDSFSIPQIESISNHLKIFGENINQYDFYAIVALFHDIHKSYTPVQFLTWLKWISWKNLTSHQFDSSTFIANQRKDKRSPLFQATLNFFIKRNLDNSKVDDFLMLIEKVIEWHAVNTEYIQIDTLKWIGNIINYIDSNFMIKEWVSQSFIKLKLLWILNEAYIKNTFDDKTIEILNHKINSNIWLNETLQYFKKILVSKYLEVNLWKILPPESIDLDEINTLIGEFPKITKLDEINNLIQLDICNKSNIEILVKEKVAILEKFNYSVNKYLHNHIENEIEETFRFIFNINDIKWYLNPSSYWFIKLIWLNNIDSLISSPLNSSFAVLSELDYQIKNWKISEDEKLMYTKMYNTWIWNIVEFISNYKQVLTTTTTNCNNKWIASLGKTYQEALETIIKNYNIFSQDELLSYKMFFVDFFSKMCINLWLQDIYPKSFDDFYYTQICNSIDEENIFCSNSHWQIFINSKTISNYLKISMENWELLIDNIPYKSLLNNEIIDTSIEFVEKELALTVIKKYSNLLDKIKKAKIWECFIRLLQAFGISEIKINNNKTFNRKKLKEILDKRNSFEPSTVSEIEKHLKKIIDEDFCFDYKVIKRLDLKYMPYYWKDLLIFEKV